MYIFMAYFSSIDVIIFCKIIFNNSIMLMRKLENIGKRRANGNKTISSFFVQL